MYDVGYVEHYSTNFHVQIYSNSAVRMQNLALVLSCYNIVCRSSGHLTYRMFKFNTKWIENVVSHHIN